MPLLQSGRFFLSNAVALFLIGCSYNIETGPVDISHIVADQPKIPGRFRVHIAADKPFVTATLVSGFDAYSYTLSVGPAWEEAITRTIPQAVESAVFVSNSSPSQDSLSGPITVDIRQTEATARYMARESGLMGVGARAETSLDVTMLVRWPGHSRTVIVRSAGTSKWTSGVGDEVTPAFRSASGRAIRQSAERLVQALALLHSGAERTRELEQLSAVNLTLADSTALAPAIRMPSLVPRMGTTGTPP
jgi:hypothetical protein